MAAALKIATDPAGYEELLAGLAEANTTGIAEETLAPDRVLLIAYFETVDEAESARAQLAQEAECIEVEAQDWSSNWQSVWQPLHVSPRLFLVPPGSDAPAPSGAVRLTMQPGNVFGSGDHPTTQLCLQLLDERLDTRDRVLDVGTGTGVLAIAAARLGASLVHGCDLDPEAVALARRASGDANTPVRLWRGSSNCCREGSYSLVLANLPGGVLLDLVPELSRLLAPEGRLLLSGYVPEQHDALRAQLRCFGFVPERSLTSGEWSAVIARATAPRLRARD